MDSLLISVETPADRELLAAMAQKMGFKTTPLSAQDVRWLARRALLDTPAPEPINDLTDADIQAEVETVRQQRYEQGHHAGRR